MWDKLKELIKQYSEISRDARTGGISSSIRDIDNMSISDSEKTQRKQSLGKDLLLGGLGDIGEAYQITKDISNKNYKAAGVGAGLLLLPGAMSSVFKPMKSAFKVLDEVPESAFKPRRTPLDEVRTMVQPSKQQVKFQDDVVKGAYFARRHPSLPHTMKEFDLSQYINGTSREGMESWIHVGDDRVLKFAKGPQLYLGDANKAGFKFGVRAALHSNLENLIAQSEKHLKGVNRLWYSEPQSMAGYYITKYGEFAPVFTQRKMSQNLDGVQLTKLKHILNPKHQVIDAVPVTGNGSIPMFDVNNVTSVDVPTKFRNADGSRIPFTDDQRVIKRLPTNNTFTPGQIKQIEYMIGKGENSILKNNIFSENDLLPPMDDHTGNFMFDKEGILRAIDIHKKGGNLNAK